LDFLLKYHVESLGEEEGILACELEMERDGDQLRMSGMMHE
jgi:hypothetical protein